MSIFDKIKQELFEETPTATATPTPAPRPQSPVMTASTAYGIGAPALTNGSTASTTTTYGPDADITKMVHDKVCVDINGVPSRFMRFLEMYETLSSAPLAMKALQVADKNLTATDILADLDAHLTLLDQTQVGALGEIDQVATQRLADADGNISGMTEANKTAQAEIEQHQHDIAERTSKIGQAQIERSALETKIAAAKANTLAATDALKTKFDGMRTFFTTAS